MAIQIHDFSFEGPYPLRDSNKLFDVSVVYAILTLDQLSTYIFIDVGESQRVRSRVENHDRIDCWHRNNRNGLYVSGFYCEEARRMRIEKILRDRFKPTCGVR